MTWRTVNGCTDGSERYVDKEVRRGMRLGRERGFVPDAVQGDWHDGSFTFADAWWQRR